MFSDTESDPPEHNILAVEQKFLDQVSAESSSVLDGVLNVIDLVIAPVVMGKNDTYSLQQALNTGRRYTNKVSRH